MKNCFFSFWHRPDLEFGYVKKPHNLTAETSLRGWNHPRVDDAWQEAKCIAGWEPWHLVKSGLLWLDNYEGVGVEVEECIAVWESLHENGCSLDADRLLVKAAPKGLGRAAPTPPGGPPLKAPPPKPRVLAPPAPAKEPAPKPPSSAPAGSTAGGTDDSPAGESTAVDPSGVCLGVPQQQEPLIPAASRLGGALARGGGLGAVLR